MTIVGYTIQWTYKTAKVFSEDREELVSLISLRANLYITSLAVNRCQEFYDCRGIREIVMTYSLLMMSHITCCVQPVTLLKCNIEIFLYSNIWSLNSVLVYCTTATKLLRSQWNLPCGIQTYPTVLSICRVVSFDQLLAMMF